MLSGVRVLELGCEGALAGQILADFGAEVVRLQTEPFPSSPVAEAYRDGKLNLELSGGMDDAFLARELEALFAGADVVIESLPAPLTARFGLDAADVTARHPHLVYVSISGFGRSGPKSHYAWSDLTVAAASGFLGLSGAPETSPLRISCPQGHAHASADAAVGILLALRHRELTGLGQSLDVSMQQSLTLALLCRTLDAPSGQPPAVRAAGSVMIGPYRIRSLFPAADGWVLALPGILPPLALFMQRLMRWVADEGLCDPAFVDIEWGAVSGQMAAGEFDADIWHAADEGIAALIARHAKHEIMAEAVARKLLVAPVLDVEDITGSEHFAARGSFVVANGRPQRPGPFAHFGAAPLTCGVGEERLAADAWSVPRRLVAGGADVTAAPLDGVRILDLFWVVAGPGATRMLADYGATVVHVESRKRLDMLRSVPPYVEGIVDPERAVGFHSTQANKLNVSLDLGTDAGREVLGDLVRWADVVTESFAPGVVERMGFGYERLKAIKPDVIMISSCLMGQTGPWRDYAGFGNLAAAVTGYHQLTGWPGEPPTGCYGPYTDFIGVRYNALAILAALRHRQQTGEGQFIDMSQAEAALNFLTPALKTYWETGHVPQAQGNRHPVSAPHAVYPCQGHDQWVAVTVQSESNWRALCGQIPALAAEPAFATEHGRKLHEAALDERVAEWTRARSPETVEHILQSEGVAAHAVLDTHGLYHDAQLVSRGHFLAMTHPLFEATTAESSRLRFSRLEARHPDAAPAYGSHNHEVLRDLLGYSEQRINALNGSGALV